MLLWQEIRVRREVGKRKGETFKKVEWGPTEKGLGFILQVPKLKTEE